MGSKAKGDKERKGCIVGVFGPFQSRALVEVPTSVAQDMVDEKVIDPAPAFLMDAVAADLAELRKRDPGVADSALGASAMALALEMSNPHNSATSKSMCAKVLIDTMERLRELAPPAAADDRIDEVNKKREQRRRRNASA